MPCMHLPYHSVVGECTSRLYNHPGWLYSLLVHLSCTPNVSYINRVDPVKLQDIGCGMLFAPQVTCSYIQVVVLGNPSGGAEHLNKRGVAIKRRELILVFAVVLLCCNVAQ